MQSNAKSLHSNVFLLFTIDFSSPPSLVPCYKKYQVPKILSCHPTNSVNYLRVNLSNCNIYFPHMPLLKFFYLQIQFFYLSNYLNSFDLTNS